MIVVILVAVYTRKSSEREKTDDIFNYNNMLTSLIILCSCYLSLFALKMTNTVKYINKSLVPI